MTSRKEQASGSGSLDAERVARTISPLPDIARRDAFRVWARIGLLSFGGPAGQIALMHRVVVEEKKWIPDTHFAHALNFCMILPGPEAQQLATYIGWLLHGIRGGLIAGTLFILPGFLVILGLSYVYVTAGSVPLVQGLFLGLKAAVIAIVLQAVIRIGRRSLDRQLLVWLAACAFVSMFVFGIRFPYVIAVAAMIGFLMARLNPATPGTEAKEKTSPNPRGPGTVAQVRFGPVPVRRALKLASAFGLLWLAPVAVIVALLGADNVYSSIGTFFSRMAVVTFGGAYAVLAYVAQEAVQVHAWLAPNEMIDGLAMAETTPGPLIMVVQFVGFMAAYRNPGTLPPGVAALLGSVLTTWVTFVPCFLWIFLGAPYMEQLRQNIALSGAFSAVTAAVVGVIANLAVWFTMHALFAEVGPMAGSSLSLPVLSSLRVSALFITVVALLLVFRLKASVFVTLLTTGLLGAASFIDSPF